MLHRRNGVAAVLLLLALASCANAYVLRIPAGVVRCFFENLEKDNKMSVSFEVASGGHLDIDFRIFEPMGRVVYSESRLNSETYTFIADIPGRYEFCFSNEMSSVSEKTVTFSVTTDVGEKPRDSNSVVKDTGLDAEVAELLQSTRSVRESLQYMRQRELTHRNTAESTNSRVQWWSIFQVIILVAVCVFQVFYLKTLFEVRGRV